MNADIFAAPQPLTSVESEAIFRLGVASTASIAADLGIDMGDHDHVDLMDHLTGDEVAEILAELRWILARRRLTGGTS